MNRKAGTYVLVIKVDEPLCLKIGKLGFYDFPEGYYTYVGSALGGLDGRLKRHFSIEKCYHWHIDYLLKSASVEEVWYTYSKQRLECNWNRAVACMNGAKHPVPRFGASDCRCISHLTHMKSHPIMENFRDELKKTGDTSELSKFVL